jgi:archaemetzincin
MEAVKPFFSPLPKPGPADWLASFNEPGQTFAEYLSSNPTVPTEVRRTIYVLPLGKFTSRQNDVIRITSQYLEAFYGLPVRLLAQQSISRPLRIKDGRINAISKKEQVRTGHILDDVLRPMLPDDAAALIAFTNEDLFPDNSMNYVFGQASLENRVGVWSLYRLDDNDDVRTFLLRTIKIATHETGHMFSMHHCIAYNCVMSGSNHLDETDSHPIDACPECMAKVSWFSHVSPAVRYQRLAEVCRRNGLEKEAIEFEKKYAAVRDIN